MSAFIIADKTLARILFPFRNTRRAQYQREADYRILAGLGIDAAQPDFIETLGLALMELNERAVNERYGERNEIAVAVRVEPTLLVQSYKALRCWLYQCTESDIPDTSPLYSAMEKISANWAAEIVENLPEYDRAEWDA